MELARQALAVIFVLGLLGGAVFLLRRGPVAARIAGSTNWLRASAGLPRTGPVLSRVGRLALTPQHILHVVRIQRLERMQDLELVVATHPQGCSVVHAGAPSTTPAPAGQAVGSSTGI